MPSEVTVDTAIDQAAGVAKSAVAGGKAFYKSKTFWANVIGVGAAYFGYLPPNIAPYVITGVNIVLRFLTTQPVTQGALAPYLS